MLEWLPESFSSWVSFFTIAAFGVLAGLNIFDRVSRKRREDLVDDRREADNVETRLVNALKEEVAVLTRKADKQDAKLAEMEKKMIEIAAENKTLREILSGRDADSVKYREQGLAAMDLIKEMAKVLPSMQNDIKELYKAINHHMQNVEDIEKSKV